MKQITKLFALLLLASLVLLAACGPTPPESNIAEETLADDYITLYVGSELAECIGEAPQTCMMVKENLADEYTFFYDQIEGFTYQEGYEYELRVLVTPVANPPADSSSLKYSLVEVVNKTVVDETAVPIEILGLNNTSWQLDNYAVDGEMVDTLPGTTFTFGSREMISTTGCNNTGAAYTRDGNAITFEMGLSTMMFCGEEENRQEDAIRANIAAVATYEISGDTMEMMDADGNIILRFSTNKMEAAVEHVNVIDETASIEGALWQADSYMVDGEMVKTLPGTQFTFADGQMAGTTGCNNTSAGYTIDGNTITFEMGVSTMMSCGTELDAQEQAIQANIAAVATYKISGNTMEMMDADGNVILQFSALEAISLTDTLWQATGINNGTGGVISVLAETTVTAVFGTDGTLSGNASCNIYNTTYEAGDGNVNVNPSIVTTRRACTEPITEQEGQYLTAIANATTYTINGDKLELRDADGSLQVSYVAVPAASLVGPTWEAVAYNSGGQAIVSVVNGSRITAVFSEDNAISGNAGCNKYFGSYTVTGTDGLAISGIGSTMMGCPENVVATQETAYLTALETAVSYTISDNKLELYAADGTLAVSYVTVEPTSLADSEWEITFHNNGKGGVTSSIIGTKMTMGFDAEGGVSGTAGCNRYFGSYEAGSELLTFGPIGSTEMFCAEPEGVMDQEMEFLAALATVTSYHIDGAMLTMRGENGETAVELQLKGYIAPETARLLENTTYSSQFTANSAVTLVNGQYQEEAAPGSASMTTVLFANAAVGTIDGNNSAAVVLATDAGGSGTFISLHLMQLENGKAMEMAAASLGDRIQINSVEINLAGEIVIDMVRHGADDPMCCPNEHAIITYMMENGALVETAVVVMDSAE